MRRIAIIGTGYVGTGMANLFSYHNQFEIVTYDLVKQPVKQEVADSDLAIVCVPTPMDPSSGKADISAVDEVVGWCDASLILIKSTVPPGTTDMLRERYDKSVCFSPEFMGEPKNFVPYWKYPDPRHALFHDFVIVGGPEASAILNYFLRVMSVDTRYISCTNLEAELCKYMINTFFATKVTFCNEWANIAAQFGVDYKKLRELWLLDPRIGRDHTAVFEDEPGFDGKCLPKDLSAIIEASAERGYRPGLLDAVQDVNEFVRDR